MSIVLGPNRYGKAETRVVRVDRDGPVHSLKDLNVSVALAGDLDEVFLSGDNAPVLPTDSQKNTVFAFARKHGIGEIEDFAFLLARHFADSQPTIHHARVEIEEYAWERVVVPGSEERHSFVRAGTEIRTALVHSEGTGAAETVVSGLKNLVVLNSTASEFHGYIEDEYTTLPPTRDRVLATEVTARWRHRDTATADYAESFRETRRCLLEAFAGTYSLSLQQTLYAMGRKALTERPELCEVRMAMPNKHHFDVDLSPFGLDNPNEVFLAADRPYGLIEGTVLTGDAPDASFAWN
ncbi:Uricase [Actinomadura rubteroloni]|uniref:Uricase n=1 Tax=Actinomadura rubteroloni TaxID=1926885 RepID=A0A2P4UI53_9ACTN|nr:urate oxidase [Actinomadura rubteroloni]POM24701.1 Uricase [Actinomadura rubteroloni]